MSRTARLTSAAILAVLSTACGSTVQYRGATVGNLPGEGLAPTTSEVSTAPRSPSGPGVDTVTGPGGAAAGQGDPSTPGVPGRGSDPGRVTGPTAGGLADAPGVTASTISVGIPYDPDAATGVSRLGGPTLPDVKRYAEIVVADINAHGGIAGRTLQPVFYADRSSGGGTAAQRAATVCEYFSKDKRVLAVLPVEQQLAECLDAKGVLSAKGSLAGFDEATYRRLPDYFDLSALATDKIVENTVAALKAQDYFTGWDVRLGQPGNAPVKVGILAPDLPAWKQVVPRVLIPALARVGVQVRPENVFIWHQPDSAAGNGDAISQMTAAELRFAQNGVTHFIPVENNSAIFFGQAAENQQYHPRYALSSALAVPTFAGNLLPYNQLKGAVGLSWYPSIDLPAAQANSATYSGAATAACLATFRRADEDTSSSTARSTALVVCDGLKLIKASVEAVPAGQPITAGTVMRALESLGTRFPSAGLPQLRYGPGRHYPASLGWHMAWNATCHCLNYRGKGYALS